MSTRHEDYSIIFDECVPKRLAKYFHGAGSMHAIEMGWSGKKNGELLKAMSEAGYDVLITTDKNLIHQQNIQESGIIVIVLAGKGNRLADLIPLVPAAMEAAMEAIPLLKPGDVMEIGRS